MGCNVCGCGLGIVDLVGGNRPCQHAGLGGLYGPTRCTPVALSYKGSEGGSTLGPVGNNCKNIASGRQSFGMLPRTFQPFGRQGSPEYFGNGGLSMAY